MEFFSNLAQTSGAKDFDYNSGVLIYKIGLNQASLEAFLKAEGVKPVSFLKVL